MISGKVGSYSTTSIDFNCWFRDEQKVVTIKTKKQKNNKKIIYPVFLECANITTDIFWEKKFNLWATGKLPKYFNFYDNCIYFTKGNTTPKCELTNDNNLNTKLCIDFFKTYGCIFSIQDEKDEKYEPDETYILSEEEVKPKNWASLSKKQQDFLLRNYVTELTKLMKLNISESNKLLQTIRLSVSDKIFNKNNIIIENNNITEIKGLMWDDSKRVFKAEQSVNKTKIKNKNNKEDDILISLPKDMIPQFSQKLEKYFEFYEKKNAKYLTSL